MEQIFRKIQRKDKCRYHVADSSAHGRRRTRQPVTDSFKLTFTNEEHDLYVFLKNTPGASREIKAFLRRWMQGGENPAEANQGEQTDADAEQERIAEIYELTFGDIPENYGSMYHFLRECGLSAIKGRLQSLTANHPKEAAEVIHLLRRTYPELKGKV